MCTCSSPRSARAARLASYRRSSRAMRIISPRRTGTSMRYGRNPTTRRLCTRGRSCFTACATSRRIRRAPGPPLRRRPGAGRATAATRSARTTRSSRRTRTTARWDARPRSAVRPTLRCSTERRSIDARAAFLHHLRPARDVGLDEFAEFLGRVADRLEAEAGDALAYLGIPQRAGDLALQLRDDAPRRSRRREQAVPAEYVEAGQARLGHGG